MATHDYVIANQSGAAFRTDLNNALSAIVSNNSNSSSPSTTYAYQWWADTSAAVLKIRNSSNNAWITLFTLAGGINVASASTFTDDVSMQGASGKDINFDASAGTLTFKDNTKALFGTGSDLEVFHDSSNSILKNSTGFLNLKSNSGINLGDASDTDNYIKTVKDGQVELYFDGTKIVETYASGILLNDNLKVALGNSDDLEISHNGTNSFISNTTGILQIDSDSTVQVNATEFKIKNAADTEVIARFIQDSVVTLNFNGVERLKVDNTICCALDNSGGTSGEGRIGFGNSGMPFIKALDTGNHGSGSLLQIYDGDGDLHAQFLRNAASSLYHDGVAKIITQSNGMTMSNDSQFRIAKETSTSGSVTVIAFQKDNPTNNVGSVTIDNSSTTYNTTSDYRLKENEKPIENAIEKIKNLKPYTFNFIDTPEKESQGFFAHEVMDYVPTAVKGKKDEVALNGMPIYQELDYSRMVPMLTAGLKALIDKVEKLETA